MTSKLRDTIIPAFMDLDLSVNGAPVKAYDKLVSAQGYLPCRVITPYNARGEGRLVRFTTLAGNRTIDWQVSDLFLLREAGTGVELVGDTLQAYQESYEALLHTLRATQWTLTACSIVPDVYEYPEGSGTFYDGIRCVSTIRELR